MLRSSEHLRKCDISVRNDGRRIFLTEDGFERKGKWRFSRKGSEIKMMIINVTEMNGNHSGGDQKLSRPNRQAHRRGLQVQPDKGRLSEKDESWQGV